MKNNKKGLTLVELLITMVLMFSVTAIAIISYNKISKTMKEDQYIAIEEQIKTAAEQYLTKNSYILNEMNKGTIYIPLKTLVFGEFIRVLVDPTTKEKLGGCSYVKVQKNNDDIKVLYDKSPDESICMFNYVFYNDNANESEWLGYLDSNFYAISYQNDTYVSTDILQISGNSFNGASFSGKKASKTEDGELMMAYCVNYKADSNHKYLNEIDESEYDKLLNMEGDEQIFIDVEEGKKNRICSLFSSDFEENESIIHINNDSIIKSLTFSKDTK